MVKIKERKLKWFEYKNLGVEIFRSTITKTIVLYRFKVIKPYKEKYRDESINYLFRSKDYKTALQEFKKTIELEMWAGFI